MPRSTAPIAHQVVSTNDLVAALRHHACDLPDPHRLAMTPDGTDISRERRGPEAAPDCPVATVAGASPETPASRGRCLPQGAASRGMSRWPGHVSGADDATNSAPRRGRSYPEDDWPSRDPARPDIRPATDPPK